MSFLSCLESIKCHLFRDFAVFYVFQQFEFLISICSGNLGGGGGGLFLMAWPYSLANKFSERSSMLRPPPSFPFACGRNITLHVSGYLAFSLIATPNRTDALLNLLGSVTNFSSSLDNCCCERIKLFVKAICEFIEHSACVMLNLSSRITPSPSTSLC